MERYDAIVLGVGGVGSSALFHLAQRGLNVLGLEQFTIAHAHGSSHGETRAIRKAYFEHPDYVPMLCRAYELWKRLEQLSDQTLLVEQGLIEIGPPDGVLVQGVRQAAKEHGLKLEELERSQLETRFPGFVLPDGQTALFEEDGGFLWVERCIEAYVKLAIGRGAKVAQQVEVYDWSAQDDAICVRTTSGDRFLCEKLVITAGSWSSDLIRRLSSRLRVVRKHLHWYSVKPGTYQLGASSPVFFYETPAGYYYGFPAIPRVPGEMAHSIKVAEHSGGQPLSHPTQQTNLVDSKERERVEKFLQSYLPDCTLEAHKHVACMYTLSPDEHFFVDCHPEDSRVVFAAGLSGHGFKFASVLGEILAALACGEPTGFDLEFLNCNRQV